MAPKLYGIPQSRALRSIWALEEVGIDYELVPISFEGDNRKPEYLASSEDPARRALRRMIFRRVHEELAVVVQNSGG